MKKRIFSLFLCLIMCVLLLPTYQKTSAAIIAPEGSANLILSDSTQQLDNKVVETLIVKNEFGEISVLIREKYNTGLVITKGIENGEEYTYSKQYEITSPANTYSTNSRITLDTKIDEFSTHIYTWTATAIASALGAYIPAIPWSQIYSFAVSVVGAAVDDILNHIYYRALVHQTLVSDGAISYYEITIDLFSYTDSARTNLLFYKPGMYYEDAYPY